jgi:hypothetical protein
MANFLSKESCLQAFKLISNQGLNGAQWSAIRYALAIDEFVKKNGHALNLESTTEKSEFVQYVSNVVRINQTSYTNSFDKEPEHSKNTDFGTSSNLFTQSVGQRTFVNPQERFQYPLRGKSVFFAQDKHFEWDETLMANVFSEAYLSNPSSRKALAIWLSRCEDLSSCDCEGINHFISDRYSQIVSDNIKLTDDDMNELNITFSDTMAKISDDDIENLFLTEINQPNVDELQVIYYGAPGTGKSHKIKKITKGKEPYRTTFHPDTDYASFVGAYKPTMGTEVVRNVAGDAVVRNSVPETKECIIYEFVPQTFLLAYEEAWRKQGSKDSAVYLVIEEINRGNCAQIFGDLFQLLDRNDEGYSEYPIHADADLKKQLRKMLSGISVPNEADINSLYSEKDVVSKVKSGEILLLPNNLYILATMNTSDQSLFPIDSAFKRRWNWQYVPIFDAHKDWVIEIGNLTYKWYDFIEAVNKEIYGATSSEDKELGYFFCKAKDGVIDAKTFVGKVIFYLWNDVFKDYDIKDSLFKDANGAKITFDKFYSVIYTEDDYDTVVVDEYVQAFLNNLKVEPINTESIGIGEDVNLGNISNESAQ